MKIYIYLAHANVYNSFLTDKEYWQIKNTIGRGNSLLENWEPFPVREKMKGMPSDFPALNGPIPAFSEKAWLKLNPYIGNTVEALKLITEHGTYYAINVLDIVDALDHTNSEISFNSASGRVSRIKKYVFDKEKIKGKYLFKIPETKGLEVYVSEEFKKIIEAEKLEGLDFKKLLFQTA